MKAALDDAPGTMTELGTTTFTLLLASDTVIPPVGAEADRMTLQESASEPVIEVLAHESELRVGTFVVPVPLRLTVEATALLDRTSWPVTEPAAAGLNRIVRTACSPGFKVAGSVSPETEKPVPETAADLIVTDAVPLAVSVRDLLTDVPTETLPKASDEVLSVRAAVDGFN